jgi:hypothetical protein
MKLTHGNKCPICGKEWTAEGNLVPNTKDREFYGGRVKYFKEVVCDCKTKYTLCVGVKEARDGTIEHPVIDMILTKSAEAMKSLEEAESKKIEYNIMNKNGGVYESKEQQETAKRETILATIVDKDTKLAKLNELTTNELRAQCRKRKINFKVKDTKELLAQKLLAADPNVVVAQK